MTASSGTPGADGAGGAGASRPTAGASHATASEARVSTLELFFDLVFVFIVTQLTSLLVVDRTVEGCVQVFLIFVVLFWMYGGYAWLTNQVRPDGPVRRLLLVAGMAGFLVCALAAPRAFAADGLAFAGGYLVVVLVHGGLYAQAYGRATLRFVPLNLLGVGLVAAASAVHAPLAYLLWLAPIGIQYAAAALTRRVDPATRAGFDIAPGHFVERHGLLLIVAFGESVVAVGAGISQQSLDAERIAVALLGLVLVAGLWWTYFAADERLGESSLTAASLGDRVAMALDGYFYAYVPMLLGIVALAAGVRLTVGRVASPLDLAPALLVSGGVALYLAGNVAFRLALRIGAVRVRAAAAVAAIAVIPLGLAVAGLAELVALAVVLVAMLALESARPGLAGQSERAGEVAAE